MTQTSIRVYLSIFGDFFDPDALTNLVKLNPTSTGVKGQPIRGKNKNHNYTFWDFSTDTVNSLLLHEITDHLLNTLQGLENRMSQFISDNNLSARLSIVIKIVGKRTPSLYFNQAF